MAMSDNPFFAACEASGNHTLTENGDLTHITSLDACVDFFYHIKDTSNAADVSDYLERAWRADPGRALRLVFYLLDVRQGKSCTNAALFALHWILKRHPQTLLANLEHVVTFGCIRDFAMLLMIARCSLAEGVSFHEWQVKKVRVRNKKHPLDHDALYKKARKVTLEGKASKLHQDIVLLFVGAIERDMEAMKNGKGISLFSKWLPSQDSYLNRTTRLFDDVAMHLYARDKQDGCHRRPLIHARNHLRRVYISPLRKHAEVVERLMSDGKWDEIAYARVPSKCMLQNAAHFAKHDSERFIGFVSGLSEGKGKINVATLKPHEICFPTKKSSIIPAEVLEAQWQAYVSSMKEQGLLNKAVAICDVSGSMAGQPMAVAVSFGLLVASLAEHPWKDHLITFSERPQFHRIQGDTLPEKVHNIQRMEWSMNTDFDLVFDTILRSARQSNLKQKDMPTTLFVFSDMQFDQAFSDVGSTAFERVKVKYAAHDYAMPQIVFWNLRDSHGVPVQVTDEGTALVSGFSGNLLKLFLAGGDFAAVDEEDVPASTEKPKMSPLDVMSKAIDDPRFDVLKVVD